MRPFWLRQAAWIRRYATESTSNLTKPAFPVKHILANPQEYQRSVDLRNVTLFENQSINDLVEQYHSLLNLKKERQAVATERNRIVEEVKEVLSKQQKRDVLPAELKQRSANAKKLMSSLEKQIMAAEPRFDQLVETVPNLIEPSVAEIKGDFEVVSQVGGECEQLGRQEQLDHVAIGQQLGILDLAAASKVSGTGNVYLTGQGALLEQALIQYALAKCTSLGFKLVSPPSLVRSEFIDACGFQPRDESTHIYRVENEQICLSGTAEIPLVSRFAEKNFLENANFPILNCGVMRSFRAEAASKGADTRGLYRLHEFSKVEMVSVCKPSQSAQVLRNLVSIQQSIFDELLVRDLGVPLRTISVAPSDLGAPAYQKYDIEAWMPGRGTWGELSSASNCLDYQARRLHIKNEEGFLHTLNATSLAIPRVILTIIENGWDPVRQLIRLPRALHKFMGTDVIVHNK